MSFTFGKIFWILMNPAVLLFLCLCASTFFAWKGWNRWVRITLTPCICLLIGLSIFDLHQIVARPLENRFPSPTHLPEQIDGIIVLGGAIDVYLSVQRNKVCTNEASERLTSFVALARKYPEAKLIFTGGSGALRGSTSTEARWAKVFFEEQGLDVDRITFEDESRNTYENAIYSRKLAPDADQQTWVLVTSGTHMPRAVGCFRKALWNVIPYPVDYRAPASATQLFSSLNSSLPLFSLSVKEWFGLVYYRMLEYTDALFPAPGPIKPET